jgi:hypothetical protein
VGVRKRRDEENSLSSSGRYDTDEKASTQAAGRKGRKKISMVDNLLFQEKKHCFFCEINPRKCTQAASCPPNSSTTSTHGKPSKLTAGTWSAPRSDDDKSPLP